MKSVFQAHWSDFSSKRPQNLFVTRVSRTHYGLGMKKPKFGITINTHSNCSAAAMFVNNYFRIQTFAASSSYWIVQLTFCHNPYPHTKFQKLKIYDKIGMEGVDSD